MKLFFLFFLSAVVGFFELSYCLGQSTAEIDSLEHVLSNSQGQDRVDVLNNLSAAYRTENNERSLKYAEQAVLLAKKINYRSGEATAFLHLGLAYSDVSNMKREKENYEQALLIWRELGNKSGIAKALNNIGLVYYYQGDYEKAVRWCLESLKMQEELNYETGIAISLGSLGNIYIEQGNYEKALDIYLKALKLHEKMDNGFAHAGILNNIGNAYNYQKDFEKAIKYYSRAILLLEGMGAKAALSIPINNVGSIYFEQKNYKGALEYYLRSLKIREEVGDQLPIASSLSNVGNVYAEQGDFKKALDCQYRSLEIAKALEANPQLKTTYEALSLTYSKAKDYKQAYVFHQLYIQVKDSIFSEESSRQIAEMQTIYESDKKEKEIDLLTKEKEVQDLALKKNQTLIYAFSGGFFLVLISAGVVFNGYRQKRRANHLLENQNNEIKLQKEIIEEKNKGITDSIQYAKRIQEVMLLPVEIVKQHLPESFIFYQPKDIVSGDFYWISAVKVIDSEVVLFAAVDCTGHGVPGAFMSIVGHNGLNRAVKEQGLTNPSAILNSLDKTVSETLRQKKQESFLRDGMDIALCSYDKSTRTLLYAGANNPLWIVRKNYSDGESVFKYPGLIEIKADKKAIGSFFDEEHRAFTNHEMQLESGDIIYIFSDGYADQFGGVKGKKLMSAKFAELLVSISSLSMPEQERVLNEKMEAWKGNLEQVDDILVMGIKV